MNLEGLFKYSIITKRPSIPLVGIVIQFSLFLFQYLMLHTFERCKTKFISFDLKFSNTITDAIEYFFLFVSIYGLLKGSYSVLNLLLQSKNFMVLFSNSLRVNISWGHGYTILTHLAYIPFTLSLTKNKKKYKFEKIASALVLILSGLLYSARAKIIYVFVCYIAYYIRKYTYKNKIRLYVWIIPAIILLLFFVITFGARRGALMVSQEYSDIFNRSFFDILDYFSTTVIFTMYGFEFPDKNFNEIRIMLGDSSILGFTNPGRYYSLYMLLGGLGMVIFIIIESYLTGVAWKRYDQEKKSGIVYYCLFLYSMLEGARLDPLATIDFGIPALLILVLNHFYRDELL